MSEEPRVVGPGWHAKVFAMVRRVPAGRVATYGQIATRLGSPRVARHVGFALAGSSRSEHDGPVPWYRIVNSRGGISTRDDTGSGLDQRGLLEEEGVEFKSNGTIDLKRYRWQPDIDPA